MKYLLFIIILILIIIYILLKNNKEHFINYNNFKLDKIYVINLEKNKDRWNAISKAAKNANIPITRFNAIYGKELSPSHPDIIKYFDKFLCQISAIMLYVFCHYWII